METNDSKRLLTGAHGVQQLHLSLVKSQPDPEIILLDHNVNDSMQNNSSHKEIYEDSPIKDSGVEGK